MFCSKCGQPLAADARFCGNCGTPVAAAPASPSSESTPPMPSYGSGAGAPPPGDASAGGSGVPPGAGMPPPGGLSPGQVPSGGMRMSGLVERAKNILLQPKAEWPVIAAEASTPRDIYLYYVAPLAAIGAIAGFIGSALIGIGIPMFGQVRMGIGGALGGALLHFVLAFLSVFIVSLIVDALAPTFGGQRDSVRALKVTAYSYTPAWIAAVLTVIPTLGILAALIGLYGLYLLYLGLPVLMRSPQDKSAGYTVVVVLCVIVIWVVLTALTTCIVAPSFNRMGMLPGGGSHSAQADSDAAAAIASKMLGGKTDADRERMKDAMATLEAMGKQAEQAQKAGAASGQSSEAAAAKGVDVDKAMNAVGTMLAGGSKVEPIDFRKLKELLPESLGALKRVEAEGQSGEAMGIKGASARGRYGEGGSGQITLEIVDIGNLSGLAGLAARFDPTIEKETNDSYERTRKVDGNLMHEQYNRRSRSGEVSMLLADRFSITARGDGVEPEALVSALKSIDYGRLAALKTAAK